MPLLKTVFSLPALLVGFAVLLAGGCTPMGSTLGGNNHKYYAPNSVHVPALRAAGEASLQAGTSLSAVLRDWDIQAAYSPIKHGAVMANHFSQNHIGFKTRFNEGGIGYYTSTRSRLLTGSVYGGYGIGTVNNTYGNGIFSDLKYSRWFLQPGLIIQTGHVRFCFGLRFLMLEYTRGLYDVRLEQFALETLQTIERESPIFLTEFGSSVGLYVRPLTLSLAFTRSPSDVKYEFQRLYAALTASVNLNEIWQKKPADAAEED